MIRIVSGSRVDPDGLVGRIVFRGSSFRWPGLEKPRLVTKVSGSRVYLEKFPVVAGEEGGDVFIAEGETEDGGHMALSSVECVCDTVAEANEVLAVTHASRKLWQRQQEEIKASFEAGLDAAGAVRETPVPGGEAGAPSSRP